MVVKAIALTGTWLKQLPLDSSLLKTMPEPLSTVEVVSSGAEYQLTAMVPFDEHNHTYIVTEKTLGDCRGWWAYSKDWKFEGTEPDNNPVEAKATVAAKPKGKQIKIPGITPLVDVSQPVYAGSNFTWAEFLAGGDRIPENEVITARLVKLAQYMDRVRSYLGGKPITITSAYRPPAVNRAVGGAKYSMHVQGSAVDFRVSGMSTVEVFTQLKSFHKSGGLAVAYYSSGNGFVHLDLRPGGPARWAYPGSKQVALW